MVPRNPRGPEPLSPVNEEDVHGPAGRSHSRGKRPAAHEAIPHERTPLVSEQAEVSHQALALDEGSEYESIMLPDMTYAQVIRSFAFVPFACLSIFAGLVLLITFAWAPSKGQPHSDVSYPYLPHGRAFLVGAAGWVVAYACRAPVYAVFTFGGRWASFRTVIIATVFSVIAQEGIRLGVLILLGVRLHTWCSNLNQALCPTPQDEAFRDTWWMALGWSAVEAGLSVFQGYEQLALYKDLFEIRDRDEETWRDASIVVSQLNSQNGSRSTSSTARDDDLKRAAILSPSDVASIVDDEILQSLQLRDREALELVFGVPLPNIPVFVSCLQRIDAQILSMGFSLLVSSTLVSEQRTKLFRIVVFTSVLVLHSTLTIVWVEALPRIGIHTASYSSLIVAIGTFLAGLALWGALE